MTVEMCPQSVRAGWPHALDALSDGVTCATCAPIVRFTTYVAEQFGYSKSTGGAEVSYPEGVAAANDVLRAAEAWRAAYGRGRQVMLEADARLRAAVDAYHGTALRKQPVIAKEAGD